MSNVAVADAVVAVEGEVCPAAGDGVAPVVAKVRAERKASVSDESIIRVWQRMARRVDENGVLNGTIQAAADELGMNKASLNQRITSLKELGLTLAKMPRAKGGGRKKVVSDLTALLESINDELDADDSDE
jgi:predicted transcriptional regulator